MNMQDLLKKYETLTYEQKRCLQLIVLCKDNLFKTNIVGIINISDLKDTTKKSYTSYNLDPILQNLTSQNLLQKDKQGKYSCNPSVYHHIIKDAIAGTESKGNINSIIKAANNSLEGVDKLELGLLFNNLELFNDYISHQAYAGGGGSDGTKGYHSHFHILVKLHHYIGANLGHIFDNIWLKNLHPDIQYWVVASKITSYMCMAASGNQEEVDLIKDLITEKLSTWVITSDAIIELFLDFFLLCADFEKIRLFATIAKTNPVIHYSILGVLEFLQDNNQGAISNFDVAIKTIKDLSKKRNIALAGTYGIFHILSLLKSDQEGNLDQIKTLLKNYETIQSTYHKELEKSRYTLFSEFSALVKYFSINHELSYQILGILVRFLESNSSEVDIFLVSFVEEFARNNFSALDRLILFLALYWTKSKLVNLSKYSADLYKKYDNILPGLLSIIKKQIDNNTRGDKQHDAGHNLNTIESQEEKTTSAPYNFDFRDIIHVKPDWERSISSLSNYFSKQAAAGKANDKRIVWHLRAEQVLKGSTNAYEEIIIPIEQKRVGNGWNKGRSAGLKRLFETRHSLDYLTVDDIPVINSIEEEYYYRGNHYYINTSKALLALAGHPLVFDAESGQHIELTKTSPELIIKENNNNFQIKLSAYSPNPTVKFAKESENKYQVIDISQKDVELVKIIGEQGITVPKAEKDKILSLLHNAASSISVRAEFDSLVIDSKPGDSTIIIQLIAIDEALKIKALVRPFGGKGSYYKPGKGGVNITAQIDNIYQGVTRNLDEEEKNINQLLDNCPTLSEQNIGDYEWKIEELEAILEILYELNNYKISQNNASQNSSINPVIIEWPQGQTLFIDKEVSFDNLNLNIRSANEWFAFDGEIEIQESQVIVMRDLLDKLENSKGRFIELSDKRFIALTKSFAKRLSELNIASKTLAGQTIHKLAAPLLLEFAEKSKNVKSDNIWQSHIDKISGAESYNPKIPKNLQVELRPYQVEGFKWLARLSRLGFGSCLADDMGLGKTVQTIGLLLTEASKGPCLVLAPASVCYVWEEECKKFAPSLNCISLASAGNQASGNNRESLINNLGKMDVLICSYGMIYQVEEQIINKQFQTIVLDEAQAIKNFNTKRFKIITKLKTETKIALSGTPIENRTDELWNLFEFLNPGFLGSRESFQTKYTKPIEIDKNIATRNTLKRLIQPFILRRVKSKVLDDLPPKIEQTIFIEPSDKEKSFYEALRRESVEKINSLDEASSAKKRFSILAEITKLRRACCDISLVNPELEMPNSKLDSFDEIVEELKENNHRALVFSQYVGYLDIVRKRLDAKKITYQYLDGSSTYKQRQKSVDSFQSGDGDLFLISLKAGGAGLNLTAADYVIHLDPWWNPAVEDQASDRAHRMGQTRPVTIYRLVMKYSIEEKILKMHSEKRDLAISLLDDADKSASLSENDLLALINQSVY
ncbi:MAG: DEAD/DEAH box helicase [Alphaproteobacteria bacterium]|nr:DEAD/DEAH box helicase [Alphaproteobacteria bacterium]